MNKKELISALSKAKFELKEAKNAEDKLFAQYKIKYYKKRLTKLIKSRKCEEEISKENEDGLSIN